MAPLSTFEIVFLRLTRTFDFQNDFSGHVATISTGRYCYLRLENWIFHVTQRICALHFILREMTFGRREIPSYNWISYVLYGRYKYTIKICLRNNSNDNALYLQRNIRSSKDWNNSPNKYESYVTFLHSLISLFGKMQLYTISSIHKNI